MTLKRSDIFDLKATALATEDGFLPSDGAGYDGDQYDREDRAALRRVAGLSTELEDITEVEYRQLRLERVVLAAVWTEGTAEDADNSMRELAALAETAGSTCSRGSSSAGPSPTPAPTSARARPSSCATSSSPRAPTRSSATPS